MPILLTSQNKMRKQPPRSLYTFVDAQKHLWKSFWVNMNGDKKKIIDFAKKSGVEAPEEWYETLHVFLFDLYPSDPLARHASKESFEKFLTKIAERHITEPKDKAWYSTRGFTESGFISMLQRAALFEDPVVSIKYMNSKMRDFGSDIYSEYLLTQTPGKKEFKSIASELNERAYSLEKSAGIDILANLEAGTKVAHDLWPNETFEVVGKCMHKNSEVITVLDQNGIIGYVLDKWNLTLA